MNLGSDRTITSRKAKIMCNLADLVEYIDIFSSEKKTVICDLFDFCVRVGPFK